MTAAADWAAVGRRLRSRINDLKLTKAEVSRLSGISPKTLTGYMDGEPIVRRDKERSLCRAVDWSDDSIERLSRGEEPVGVQPGPDLSEVELVALVMDLRQRVEAIEQRTSAEHRADDAEAAYKAKLSQQSAERTGPLQRLEEAEGQQRAG